MLEPSFRRLNHRRCLCQAAGRHAMEALKALEAFSPGMTWRPWTVWACLVCLNVSDALHSLAKQSLEVPAEAQSPCQMPTSRIFWVHLGAGSSAAKRSSHCLFVALGPSTQTRPELVHRPNPIRTEELTDHQRRLMWLSATQDADCQWPKRNGKTKCDTGQQTSKAVTMRQRTCQLSTCHFPETLAAGTLQRFQCPGKRHSHCLRSSEGRLAPRD